MTLGTFEILVVLLVLKVKLVFDHRASDAHKSTTGSKFDGV
jgi:hypothetical protein